MHTAPPEEKLTTEVLEQAIKDGYKGIDIVVLCAIAGATPAIQNKALAHLFQCAAKGKLPRMYNAVLVGRGRIEMEKKMLAAGRAEAFRKRQLGL